MLFDYHVHTNNSFDSKAPMEEMCAHAVELGMSEIAFTDHLNSHRLDIDLGYYDPERFFMDVDRCRRAFPHLSIRTGIEVGEPHRWGSKVCSVIEHYPYDMVLGSVHWIRNTSILDPGYYRSQTPGEAFGQYFQELLAMVKTGGFDILAHIDVPKRSSFDVYGAFRIEDFEDDVRLVLQACIDNGITPEVNTKGLRHKVAQLHPSPRALCWYREMGGERITIGSDAHHPGSLGSHLDVARQSALDAGLTRVCRFEHRQLVEWIAL